MSGLVIPAQRLRCRNADGRINIGGRLARALMLGVLSLLVGLLVAGAGAARRGGPGITTKNAIGDITFSDLPACLQSPPLVTALGDPGRRRHQLATFYYENRQSVSLYDVAPTMRQAIVAIEDSRFYEHHGVDPKGILRALVERHLVGRRRAGRLDDHPAVRAPGTGRDERPGRQHRRGGRGHLEEPDPQAHRGALRAGA